MSGSMEVSLVYNEKLKIKNSKLLFFPHTGNQKNKVNSRSFSIVRYLSNTKDCKIPDRSNSKFTSFTEFVPSGMTDTDEILQHPLNDTILSPDNDLFVYLPLIANLICKNDAPLQFLPPLMGKCYEVPKGVKFETDFAIQLSLHAQ